MSSFRPSPADGSEVDGRFISVLYDSVVGHVSNVPEVGGHVGNVPHGLFFHFRCNFLVSPHVVTDGTCVADAAPTRRVSEGFVVVPRLRVGLSAAARARPTHHL